MTQRIRLSISVSNDTFERLNEYTEAMFGPGTKGRRSAVIDSLLRKGMELADEQEEQD